MLRDNKEFVLIGDQKVEFEQIKKVTLEAIKNNQKTVYYYVVVLALVKV